MAGNEKKGDYKTRTGEPLKGFYFEVRVDGMEGIYEAAFENVSGLDVKIETEAIQEGGVNEFTRKLPKGLQYSNLVLRRGVIKGTKLVKWINDAVKLFTFDPKRIQVNLLNEVGDPSINWSFYNAYPVSIKISDLNSTENKYVVETLEIAYDFFERTDIIK